MSFRATAWAWEQRHLPPTQRLTLMALVEHINERGECWPSMRRLATDTNLAERTVARALGDLETVYRLIRPERRVREDGSMTPILYLLAMDMAPGLQAEAAE